MGECILRLSDEQRAAVDITSNIAVSAGAGSGKTRVLTNRYLNLLEDGINIEEIVAITFTEKAALEMKERIRGAINDNIENSDYESKLKWKHALDKLSRANISTIHSFCAKILRENAASLGIDFNFSIISAIDKNNVLNNAGKEVLDKYINIEKYKSLVEKLYDTYGEKEFNSKIIKELLGIREKITEEGKTLKEVYEELSCDQLSEFLISMLIEIENLYMEFKLASDLLDYSDLESMSAKILKDKRISSRYKERYRRFLVDESQDTNRIQKNIIYSLVTDENKKLLHKRLFIVGDFKQSIYGFRGANSNIFKEVSDDIGKDKTKSLSTCYRSEPEIITGINEVFSKLIEDYENLKSPRESTIKEKRLMLLTYKKSKSDSSNIVKEVKEAIKDKAMTLENFSNLLEQLKAGYNSVKPKVSISSSAVVKGIRRLIDKGLNYKDICILVRSKYIISDIEEELKKLNIPYCIIGGRGFYDKSEVKELLNFYKVLQYNYTEEFDSEMELNLIRLLRSFIFNISDDLLYKIKLEQFENSTCKNFFEAMEFTIDGLQNDEDKEVLSAAYNSLIELMETRDKVCVVQLLKSIIYICGIKEMVLAQEGGLQKFRNIEKLLYEAEKFDNENIFSPSEFLDYINLLNENNLEDAEASLDTEDAEAIKIMTIHQSKGLEFEGVIIPAMDADQLSMTHREIKNHNFVFHDEKIISRKSLIDEGETDDFINYTNYKLLKEVDESIRVFYVALTRAKKYVLMVGAESVSEITEIGEEIERADKLNTFLNQLNYAFQFGNADKNILETIEYDELESVEKVGNEITALEKIEEKILDNRLSFISDVKPRNYVSASKHMKYTKCQRRFFVENVLRIKPDIFDLSEEVNSKFEDFQEEKMIDVVENEIVENKRINNYLSASDLGSLVHKILELKLDNKELKNDEIIHSSFENLFSKNALLFDDVEKANLYKKVKRYINNYEVIEDNRVNCGQLLMCQSEVSFTITPLDDRKTTIVGFIDRMEVFEKDNKYIAVITDYKTNRINNNIEDLADFYSQQLNLYGKAVKDSFYLNGRKIDEVQLKLYFLDIGIVKNIDFNDVLINSKVKEMDIVFGRKLDELSINTFEKSSAEQCEKCDYAGLCNQ